MIFSQYTETCEFILYYPKIGGDDDIEYYAKNAISNLLHTNIDAHSRILISEFPKYGIKFTEKLQSHCEKKAFAHKIRYYRTFQQVTHKGEESANNYIKGFHNAYALPFSVGNSYSEDQLMHKFLDNYHQDGKYSARIAIHREETFTDKNH